MQTISIIIITLILIIFLMMLDKKIRTITFKNLFRRKTQTLLIILGSMVGTAMITGSLGINDSMKYMLYTQTRNDIGEIDLMLYKSTGNNSSKRSPNGEICIDFEKSQTANFAEEMNQKFYTDQINEIYVMNINIFSGTNTISNLVNNSAAKIIAFDFEKEGVFSQVDLSQYDAIVDGEIFGKNSVQNKNISIAKSTGKTLEVFNRKYPLENVYISDQKLLKMSHFQSNQKNAGCVYMDLDYFYKLFPEKKNKINAIVISNTGDWLNGRFLSSQVIEDYNQTNLSSQGFQLLDIKNQEINAAGMANIGYLFLFLSFFSILAGLFLIINTFNMLAKERSKELGMLRAIGFLKKDIKKLFFLEGIIYTVFSSALGVVTGFLVSKYILGNITQYVFSLSNKFLEAIGNTFINLSDIPEFQFYISWDSIIISYVSGIIVSLITVYFFSRKISKFNIVNAIKEVEEEKASAGKVRKYLNGMVIIAGIALIVYGQLSTLISVSYLGYALFLLPVGILLYKLLQKKTFPLYLKGILYNLPLITLLILSYTINVDLKSFPVQYLLLIIEKSITIILTLSILFMNNLIFFRKLMTKTHIAKLFKPYVLKIGIAYPEHERKKTALMIAMYALVIYIIVLVSIIPYTQQKGIERSKETIFWSYDAFIPDIFNSTPGNLKDDLLSLDFVDTVNEIYSVVINSNIEMNQHVFVVDENVDIDSEIGIWYGEKSIQSIEDALLSMQKNKNHYIILKSDNEFSDDIKLNTADSAENEAPKLLGTFVFKNISFFQGIVFNNPDLIDDTNKMKYMFVKMKGANSTEKAENMALFKTYIEENNLFAISDDDVVEITQVATTGLIQILNGFLYFGMIIGIIGISITMYRAFLDRKKVIGMLKAIGFTGKEIFSTFLFETSIIVIIGLFIGTLSGIITSSLVNALFSDIGAPGGNVLSIPWLNLIQTAVIFYLFSILSTFIPSFQASRLSPAEALKYYE